MRWGDAATLSVAVAVLVAVIVGFRRRRRGSFRFSLTVERVHRDDDEAGGQHPR